MIQLNVEVKVNGLSFDLVEVNDRNSSFKRCNEMISIIRLYPTLHKPFSSFLLSLVILSPALKYFTGSNALELETRNQIYQLHDEKNCDRPEEH